MVISEKATLNNQRVLIQWYENYQDMFHPNPKMNGPHKASMDRDHMGPLGTENLTWRNAMAVIPRRP